MENPAQFRVEINRRRQALTENPADQDLLERIDNLEAAWTDLCLYERK